MLITRRKMRQRISLLLLVVVIAIGLRQSSQQIVFSNQPEAKAVWVTPDKEGNIGGVTEVTLVITTQPGVIVNYSRMPNVGGVFAISISEGELEVVYRKISRHHQEDWVITEITYGLQYLLAIDFNLPFDEKRLPMHIPLYQEYLLDEDGETRKHSTIITVETNFINIYPRGINEESAPIWKFFKMTPTLTKWHRVKQLGYILIGTAICIVLWKLVIVGIWPKRKITPKPDYMDYYNRWRDTYDQKIFIEFLILYRLETWCPRSIWGWWKSTYILYSGDVFNHYKAEEIFAKLITEIIKEMEEEKWKKKNEHSL